MNLKTLEDNGYMILNGIAQNVSVIKNDNKLILIISVVGEGWNCDYGGYDLNEITFSGTQSIVDLMNTLDVDSLYDIKDKSVRLAAKLEEPVNIIGNIVYDKWFDFRDYVIDSEEPQEVEQELELAFPVSDNSEEGVTEE